VSEVRKYLERKRDQFRAEAQAQDRVGGIRGVMPGVFARLIDELLEGAPREPELEELSEELQATKRQFATVSSRLGEERKRNRDLEIRLRVKDAEVSRLGRAVECLTANVDKPCKCIGPDPDFKGCNDSCVPRWYHVSEVEDAQMRAAMHADDRIRELEAEVQHLRSERNKLQRERDLLTRDAAELDAMGKKLERRDARIQKLEAELEEARGQANALHAQLAMAESRAENAKGLKAKVEELEAALAEEKKWRKHYEDGQEDWVKRYWGLWEYIAELGEKLQKKASEEWEAI